MDFFQHQDVARRKTGLLIAYFAAAVVLIILSVYLVIVVAVEAMAPEEGEPLEQLFNWPLLLAVAGGTILVIASGSLYKTAVLAAGGGAGVADMLGGRLLRPDTQNLHERVLLNVVEEMAIASGTPVPPVYVLNEGGINAFAAGYAPSDAVVAVTRGCLETLTRDELQGVIAHEFSHILNGDMRLNIRLLGVLHGILLIALVGWFIFRSTLGSGSSRSGGGKKGGNPLPFIGLAIYIVGYVGVFFGHLIKSAVSRQREFLADASAVQFTRNPDGIAGALKKIGGMVEHGRIENPRAEEISHMMFVNGLAEGWFNVLATHPPLGERIRRIDPSFDGRYPEVRPVTRSVAELYGGAAQGPRRSGAAAMPGVGRAAQVAALGAAGAAIAAMSGNQAPPAPADAEIIFEPKEFVRQLGSPGPEHIAYAADVMATVPENLRTEVHDPLGAVASVYALLAPAGDDGEEALKLIASRSGAAVARHVAKLAPDVRQLSARARLPLVEMALPALRQMSSQQFGQFRATVGELIAADRKVSLFEYALQNMLLGQLRRHHEGAPPPKIRYATLPPVLPACSSLLSAMAYAGHMEDGSEEGAKRAFLSGARELGGSSQNLALLPRSQAGLAAVDRALVHLGAASPQVKKKVLSACAACVGADGRVTVEEGEMLRAVADALDCPAPPILGS